MMGLDLAVLISDQYSVVTSCSLTYGLLLDMSTVSLCLTDHCSVDLCVDGAQAFQLHHSFGLFPFLTAALQVPIKEVHHLQGRTQRQTSSSFLCVSQICPLRDTCLRNQARPLVILWMAICKLFISPSSSGADKLSELKLLRSRARKRFNSCRQKTKKQRTGSCIHRTKRFDFQSSFSFNFGVVFTCKLFNQKKKTPPEQFSHFQKSSCQHSVEISLVKCVKMETRNGFVGLHLLISCCCVCYLCAGPCRALRFTSPNP